MVFPMGGDSEMSWPDGFRGFLYAVGMIYWFLGVAIVADVFMASIEKVTSRRKKVRLPDGRTKTVKAWNETVATLTLMALGSSAPEIFLSVIDIVKKNFHFGALGPSTIIGSAAFNLLVIIAVCIAVIPAGEGRSIFNLPAFYITAIFSVAAYVWMAVMLSWISPEIVEVWEAALTFLMLPALVWISYKTDVGSFDRYLRMARLIPPEEAGEAANPYGYVTFASELVKVNGSDGGSTVEVAVVRRKVSLPSSEPIVVNWRTEPTTAVPGYDFEAAEGSVEFANHESEKIIELSILGKPRRISDCEFLVVLSDLEGGPSFDPNDDGGEDEAILTVRIIKHGPEASSLMRVLHAVYNLDNLKLGLSDWREQTWNNFFVNGSLEEQREASASDWAMHLIAFPWKVIFGLLPPTVIFGGWACFFASLGGIAVLTACVSDLAELFGCVMGIADIVTAVSFVALGTSMPDLFASLNAAKEDPTADASIVNVTGSNSVNVFVGLGVPWTLAAVFWSVTGRTAEWELMYPDVAARISGPAFVVETSNLGFSVGAFCYVCGLALAVLYFRRRWLQCELGGPALPKMFASLSFVLMWVLWVLVVSFRVLSESGDGAETGVIGGGAGLGLLLTLVTLILTRRARIEPSFESHEGHHSNEGRSEKLKTVEDPAAPSQASPRPEATDKISAANLEDKLADDTDGQIGREGSNEFDDDIAGDLGQEKSREPTGAGIRRNPSSAAVIHPASRRL